MFALNSLLPDWSMTMTYGKFDRLQSRMVDQICGVLLLSFFYRSGDWHSRLFVWTVSLYTDYTPNNRSFRLNRFLLYTVRWLIWHCPNSQFAFDSRTNSVPLNVTNTVFLICTRYLHVPRFIHSWMRWTQSYRHKRTIGLDVCANKKYFTRRQRHWISESNVTNSFQITPEMSRAGIRILK